MGPLRIGHHLKLLEAAQIALALAGRALACGRLLQRSALPVDIGHPLVEAKKLRMNSDLGAHG
eukprot:5381894-Alexandrium_andersonii.AAC.1